MVDRSSFPSPRTGPPVGQLAFAADFPNLESGRALCQQLRGHIGVLKVGLELFVAEGSRACELAQDADAELFLDLKLHDIPKTTERAAHASRKSGARYLTVHAAGGPDMLKAALEGAGDDALVLAVTALTSLSDADVAELGFAQSARTMAARLADKAFASGIRGFVCSAHEVAELRSQFGNDVILVTPGIRQPTDAGQDDQQRIATPRAAIAAGADLLVVGRPIRNATAPCDAAKAIAQEIAIARGSE